jgi:hypothetical protein
MKPATQLDTIPIRQIGTQDHQTGLLLLKHELCLLTTDRLKYRIANLLQMPTQERSKIWITFYNFYVDWDQRNTLLPNNAYSSRIMNLHDNLV